MCQPCAVNNRAQEGVGDLSLFSRVGAHVHHTQMATEGKVLLLGFKLGQQKREVWGPWGPGGWLLSGLDTQLIFDASWLSTLSSLLLFDSFT